jgi:hypothetical protein
MLIGSVPPSGLIKVPFWERESTLRTRHLIRSINVLSFAVGDDLKLGHSLPHHKIRAFVTSIPTRITHYQNLIYKGETLWLGDTRV